MAYKYSVPRWLAKIYLVCALALLPWTLYLAYELPVKHLSEHWDISWVGLDSALIISLALTGLFAYRRSRMVVITAASTGCLLLIDAWFDILSARHDFQFVEALILAVGIELPLAFLSYGVAIRSLERHVKRRIEAARQIDAVSD